MNIRRIKLVGILRNYRLAQNQYKSKKKLLDEINPGA